MDAAILWDKLRAKASLSEFEIHTVPQNKSIPLWFLIGVSDKHLVIKKAQSHTPSVNISMDRMITYKDFEYVYRFYDRWLKGDTSSRQEAAKKSQNTAYIFALITEAHKEVGNLSDPTQKAGTNKSQKISILDSQNKETSSGAKREGIFNGLLKIFKSN